MNKYNIHLCFVLIFATVMSITEAGSRKRYRKKKSLNKNRLGYKYLCEKLQLTVILIAFYGKMKSQKSKIKNRVLIVHVN